MSQETNWFQDYDGEKETPAERCFWRKVGFSIFIGISLALILGPLYGCSTTKEGPRNEVCMFRLLGNTSDGMPVVATTCVTPEAFAESQK
jgi:hypothetical protein